jgi:carboxyl-terminal processing protease
MKRLFIGCVALMLMAVSVFAQNSSQNSKLDLAKLQRALYYINELYVDDVEQSKLVEDAIVGMLDKLDPHSTYTDVEETKELTEPLQGNFDGIGIQFNMLTDTLYVIQVISGGPSERAGLLPGDRIIMVNDTLISGVKMKTNDVMKRLRGPKNTQVKVSVLRGENMTDYTITRGKIPVYSIDAAYMLNKNVGYIKVNRFAGSTMDEFKKALANLKAKGMKNLILDLQGNGGGYLGAAVGMADEFLDANNLIVYTEGRKQPRDEARSTKSGDFKDGRLVVLVDEFSASASEIVSGAIQDLDRGLIIGRRTFGKGLVQKPIMLPDGSMIRLTVSRYYTPSGRSIQRPYVKGEGEQYGKDLIERYNKGELISADSIHFPDSMKYTTVNKQRIVYGGGGIMPDVFIPVDTARYTNYHRAIVASGIINRAVMNYVDVNRSQLKEKYPDFDAYKKDFNVPDQLMETLVGMASADSIKLDESQYEKSKKLIRLQLKALIARDIFDMNAYYEIINEDNSALKEALRIIDDKKLYDNELSNRK